ncbi:hypothetical protein [Streptomyces sp. CAU 1734]|uniref:hypothetical protein n=1 Tax=Streptomyces sp. CAU 1734 TaxID=3140360 RepID=UPI003260667A
MPLGVFALVQSLAVAWIAYDRTRMPVPQAGDHAWWHGSGPARAAVDEPFRTGVFLVLVVVAFYTVLVLAAAAGQVLRRRAPAAAARAGGAAGQLLFAAAGHPAAAAVPVVWLAVWLGPDGTALGPAVRADVTTAVRLCGPAALLLVFCAGVPWRTPGAETTIPTQRA